MQIEAASAAAVTFSVSQPKPCTTLLILIGIPTACSGVAVAAAYSNLAILVAGLLPLIAIIVFLVTPLTPPQEADEDLPCSPGSGMITRAVTPASCMSSGFAFTLQISMGFSAMAQIQAAVLAVASISAGLILSVVSLVAIGDSDYCAF